MHVNPSPDTALAITFKDDFNRMLAVWIAFFRQLFKNCAALQPQKKMAMHTTIPPPVLGFAAHQGAGKTHLLLQLLPLLCERGTCAGIIKHIHQNFDADKPGTDSYLLRKSGAQQTLVTSNQRWALMVEREYEHEPRIDEHLAHFEHETLDLISVEGFTNGTFPKIELHRPSLGRPLLFPGDPTIIAVAGDSPLILPDQIEQLDLNQLNIFADYICRKSLNFRLSSNDEKNQVSN